MTKVKFYTNKDLFTGEDTVVLTSNYADTLKKRFQKLEISKTAKIQKVQKDIDDLKKKSNDAKLFSLKLNYLRKLKIKTETLNKLNSLKIPTWENFLNEEMKKHKYKNYEN